MPDPTTLAVFGLAAVALLVVPGPAVLYIVTRSIEGGRSAGLVSVLGVHVGTLVHIAAAAIGISSLVLSSAVAFSIVKYLGAAYLVFLGIRALRAHEDPEPIDAPRGDSRRRLFTAGVVVNVLNPKTALFFLAFLPQFVDPDAGRVGLQMLVLGLVFIALGLVTDGAYALIAGAVGGWLTASPRYRALRRWVSGTVFIGLGVLAAATGSKKS